SLDNLHHLCRPHHLLKTHQPGWQVHRNPDTGAITWTTPTGQTGVTYPTSYKHTHPPADHPDQDPDHHDQEPDHHDQEPDPAHSAGDPQPEPPTEHENSTSMWTGPPDLPPPF
ncbi:MAG: hypothetical protein ACK5MT_02045, partial [Actinomycetales bacterium]